MRKLLNIVGLFACLCAVTACQNPTAAKTLLSVGEAVNGAMNVYGELYRAGALTEAEVQDVRAQHARFQVVYGQAVFLVENDLTKLAPAELADLAFELILVINQLKARQGT